MKPEQLTRISLLQILERIGVKASVHCHPHRFRPTFAIQCVRKGGDAYTLGALLTLSFGHGENVLAIGAG